MDAIVTDIHTRAAVAGLRGLGRSGRHVVAVGPPGGAGHRSRYAAASVVAPLPAHDAARFIEAISKAAIEHGPLVVYAGREASIDALFAAAGDLPPEAVLPYPGPEPLARLRDKSTMARLAEGVGLMAPRTLFDGPARQLTAISLPDACIVKPRRPAGALATARLIESPSALDALAATLPADERILVQERLPGDLHAVALVIARDGTVAARFQQRAQRIWPPHAGISASAVSVAPDDELMHRTARLLVDAGYWGMAQVQLIDSPRGYAIIDVNPRFFGSLPLALRCGINLPAVWHAVTVGGGVGPPRAYRSGVSYRWLEADVLGAAHGGWRELLRVSARPSVGAVWARDDPVPSAVLAFQLIAHSAVGRLRRSRLR